MRITRIRMPSIVAALMLGGGLTAVAAPPAELELHRRTHTVYGDLTGVSAVGAPEIRYSSSAMGRGGALDALQSGNSGDGFVFPAFRLLPDKPFTLDFSLYLYPSSVVRNGALFNVLNGHGGGFSLGMWQIPPKSGKPENAGFNFTATTRAGKQNRMVKNFTSGVWHRLAVTGDASSLKLYWNGRPVAEISGALRLPKAGAVVELARNRFPRTAPIELKFDDVTLYPEALSAAKIAALHAARPPVVAAATPEREAMLLGLKAEIPPATRGVFAVGESIPITLSATGADAVTLNGKSQPLPLRKPLSVRFDTPGLHTATVALSAGGCELFRRNFPVLIVGAKPRPGAFAANDLLTRQPEGLAFGVRVSRETVLWNTLEPKPGEYDFDALDRIVAQNDQAGIETVLHCTGRPHWAVFPKAFPAYGKLFNLLAARYPTVTYFEVGGAEANWQNAAPDVNGAEKIYAAALAVAAAAVREANPQAKIVGGKFHRNLPLTRAVAFARANAGNLDVLSIRLEPRNPQAETAELRAAVAAGGKPVWITSGDVPEPLDGARGRAAAEREAARLTAARNAGAARVFLDAGPMRYENPYSLRNGTPGHRAKALADFAAGENASASRPTQPAKQP